MGSYENGIQKYRKPTQLPGGLQPMGPQRAGHDGATNTLNFFELHNSGLIPLLCVRVQFHCASVCLETNHVTTAATVYRPAPFQGPQFLLEELEMVFFQNVFFDVDHS